MRAKQEMTSLQEAADKAAAEKAKLEDSKAKRLQKLKGSTPDALQIMREAVGDSAGHVLAASYGQVGLGGSCLSSCMRQSLHILQSLHPCRAPDHAQGCQRR